MKHKNDGFTLLEMCIVIIIIGLVVGAIFTTRTLVRAAQLQNLLAEYDTYIKAVNEFKDKFLALPGDMNDATPMWGDEGDCAAPIYTNIPHILTCDGDGNGTIGSSDTSANLSNSKEWFRAWQHLNNSGFIAQKFTGIQGIDGPTEAVPGQNVPMSTILGTGWTLMYYLQSANNANFWGGQYGHILAMGGFSTNTYTIAPSLAPGEALSIDQKIDDGNPGLGFVRAWRSAILPGCTTDTGTALSQTYVSTNDASIKCSLVFILGF